MSTYEDVRQILSELDGIFQRIDETEVDALCDALLKARRVFVHGLGREGLAMRSFAMRLFHMGVPVTLFSTSRRRP
jgi:6-phospho-3-hexuloisomerase